MPKPVDTVVEDPAWEALGLDALAQRAAIAALRHLGHDPADFEISLLGCNDARIAGLNSDFRGKPRATNVLSWPSDDLSPDVAGELPRAPQAFFPGDGIELGDIALALETCLKEAQDAERAPESHITHLLVHGLLHLLGYDHETEEDAVLMERTETEILEQLGIADPYADRGATPAPHG